MSDLSEKRTSKFFNRALPDPPSSVNNSSARKGACPDELNNLYELISQSTAEDGTTLTAAVVNSGEMYEDIDECVERTDVALSSASFNDSSSSHRSSNSRSSSIQQAGRNPPDDDEYLEPVIPPEEELRHSSNFRPSPAPRLSLSAASEVLQTSYVNAEMMSTKLASLDDGFATMTAVCRDALEQIAERMTAQYMSPSWPASCHLEWSHFDISDNGQPHLIQQHVSFYRARHPSLAPKGCVLMVRVYLLMLASLQFESVNPFKPSGVIWLHFTVFSTILV